MVRPWTRDLLRAGFLASACAAAIILLSVSSPQSKETELRANDPAFVTNMPDANALSLWAGTSAYMNGKHQASHQRSKYLAESQQLSSLAHPKSGASGDGTSGPTSFSDPWAEQALANAPADHALHDVSAASSDSDTVSSNGLGRDAFSSSSVEDASAMGGGGDGDSSVDPSDSHNSGSAVGSDGDSVVGGNGDVDAGDGDDSAVGGDNYDGDGTARFNSGHDAVLDSYQGSSRHSVLSQSDSDANPDRHSYTDDVLSKLARGPSHKTYVDSNDEPVVHYKGDTGPTLHSSRNAKQRLNSWVHTIRKNKVASRQAQAQAVQQAVTSLNPADSNSGRHPLHEARTLVHLRQAAHSRHIARHAARHSSSTNFIGTNANDANSATGGGDTGDTSADNMDGDAATSDGEAAANNGDSVNSNGDGDAVDTDSGSNTYPAQGEAPNRDQHSAVGSDQPGSGVTGPVYAASPSRRTHAAPYSRSREQSMAQLPAAPKRAVFRHTDNGVDDSMGNFVTRDRAALRRAAHLARLRLKGRSRAQVQEMAALGHGAREIAEATDSDVRDDSKDWDAFTSQLGMSNKPSAVSTKARARAHDLISDEGTFFSSQNKY